MRGLTRDTINEVADRKIVWVFGALVLLSILITLGVGASNIRIQMGQSEEGAMTAAMIPLKMFYGFMSILVFVAVMVAAASIPSMLGRGRSDFYLSKPVSRNTLFLGKLIGMMTAYGTLVLISGVIIYLVIAASLHDFDTGAGYILLYALVELAVWLIVITWAGLFSGSTTVAIVTAFVVWILQTLLDKRQLLEMMLNSRALGTVLDIAYWVVPKTSQLGQDGVCLATGQPVTNWWALPATLGFALVTLIVSLGIFAKKEL
jgi:hypothetical protein